MQLLLKRILILLLAVLLLSSVSCSTPSEGPQSGGESTSGGPQSGNESTSGGPNPQESGAATDAPPERTTLTLVENGVPKLPIITSARASDAVLQAAMNLLMGVYERTGTYLDSAQDYTAEAENGMEILIGETNRPESAEGMEALEPYGFLIRVTETNLILVGWDDAALVEGMHYLLNSFLTEENAEFSEGTLRLKVGAEYRSSGLDNSFFWDSLRASDTLVAEYTEECFTMSCPTGTTWPQGGCIKDGCYYQAFIRKDTASNEKNNTVIVAKYDLKTHRLLQLSEALDLNHSNDITYNPKRGCFVVCHNNPYRTKLSFLDPETLEVTGTTEIGVKIYSIDYNPSTDRYVVGCSGGQSFRILDGDFNFVGDLHSPTSRTKGYTTQGVTSDDRYIYFVLYNKNVITVYDWDGEFVTLIELNVGSIEPESIAVVRNEIYVACGTSGCAKLFRIGGFVPKE